MVDLDDPSETVFIIPFEEDERDGDWDESFDGDCETGPELRWCAYKQAWEKCLHRIQNIVHKLHQPVVQAISEQIDTAYSQTLIGLPKTELPVIAVSNPAGGTAFLDTLRRHLDPNENDTEPSIFTNHISPVQCPNLMTGMKAIISGFTKRPPDKKKSQKIAASSSLASYDIGLLDAWYTAVRNDRQQTRKPAPTLVVMLHDFERFDPSVMQDILYICSLHIPQTPIVFVISLLSPQSPTYLHVTYPRSTLAALRIRQFSVPSGHRLLESIMLETFFNVEFEPDLMLGPSALQYIMDHCERYDCSVEGLIRLIQLAHLKHFTTNPLTLLCHETDSVNELESPPFVDLVVTRLMEPDDDISEWSLTTVRNKIVEARDLFSEAARRKRLGFGLIQLVYTFLGTRGARRPPRESLLKLAARMLTKKVMGDVKQMTTHVRQMAIPDVPLLLTEIYEFVGSVDDDELAPLPKAKGKDARDKLANWLASYIEQAAAPFNTLALWDVWCTELTPYPMELVNPSLRASVLAGLLRSHEFTVPIDLDEEGQEEQPITELPDTSILFQRYLDSGRMLNVYDWYEAFQGVLEMQKEHLERERKSLSKKGKGKERASGKQSEKAWKLECQARFIRALHELDYMGFVKHTGRKADHVQRTVFEVGDED